MSALYKSRSANSSLNQSQKVKTFCKICYDSGKPESLYNSHFVRESRDINSRVVCPTLLAISCRFCGVRGHTVSKCKKALMAPVKAGYEMHNKKMSEVDIKSVQKNLFDCLSDEDDDTISDTSTVFPMLSIQCTTPRSQISYASVLRTPAPVNRDVCASLSDAKKMQFAKSWSDFDSDSDEE